MIVRRVHQSCSQANVAADGNARSQIIDELPTGSKYVRTMRKRHFKKLKTKKMPYKEHFGKAMEQRIASLSYPA